MWKIFGAVAIVVLSAIFGFLVSGGRINFRRAKVMARDRCPGCGAVGQSNDGSTGDAALYWCTNHACRVREYKVYPYDF